MTPIPGFLKIARIGAGGRTKRSPSTMDRIKWAYTKVALLFAISILVTWVPASVNRVYGLRFPNNPSFALNVCSSIVLPLQGFWNTVIYFTTSLPICKRVWAEIQGKRRGRRGKRKRERGCRECERRERMLDSRRANRGSDDESEVEFKGRLSERSIVDFV